MVRLAERGPATVIASRPVTRNGLRLNESFVWTAAGGYAAVHHKPGSVCSSARSSGRWRMRGQRPARVQLLVTPRAAGRATVEKWIVGGSAAAIVSGAYSLSSNWTATGDGGDFGGAAWVLAYTVAERTQEIGLRRALGAPAARVLGLVMSQGLAPVAVGIALGIAATISASSVSETQLFGISPTDPQTYVLVAAGVLAAAVLACVLPARRAVRVSPLVALREM